VDREVGAIGMPKPGATFVSPWHDHATTIRFAEATDTSLPMAYQVRRSAFDEILFRRAAAAGADARERVRVREVELGDRGRPPLVSATDAAGAEHRWRPRFVIDASGRDTFVAGRLGLKRRNAEHNSAALFGHFRGARRDCGPEEGNIIIYWFEHGWFWFIPLRDGVTSVGAVVWPYYLKARDKPVREYFLDTIAMCPQLAERLAHAVLLEEPTATGNYSYESTRCQGENFVLLGDAFAFVDPVFSSGVLLAMNSAFAGVEVAEARLAGDAAAEAAARTRFDRVMRRGPKVFSWFIYRVTNPALRDLFMSPSERLGIKKAIVSVLAGDLFRGTPIGRGLLLFRLAYYAGSIANLRRTLAAWRRRAFNIRDDSEMRLTRG
ncbi:MAG TPA: tryptophan 7-halogenase, partial [Myxococcota bacterium]|nr:tryptophan 7-halogenase [Myxococcota bacterium]